MVDHTTDDTNSTVRNDTQTRDNSFVENDRFKYSRAEPVPVGKTTGATKKVNTIPPLEKVHYNEVDDTGVGDQKRQAVVDLAKEQRASSFDSAKAGFYQTVTFNVMKKLTSPEFTPVPDFDASEVLKTDPRVLGMSLTGEELDAVKESKSPEELEYRLNMDVDWYRDNQKLLSDHPVIAVSTAIVGDSAAMLVPMLTPAKFGKTAYNVARLMENTSYLSAALYTQDELGQSPINTVMVGGFAAVDSAFAVRNIFKVKALSNTKLNALDEAIRQESKLGDSTIHIDPDAPKVPTPTANLADDSLVMRSIPDDVPTRIPVVHPSLIKNTVNSADNSITLGNSLGKVGSTKAVDFRNVLEYITSSGYTGGNAELVSALGSAIIPKLENVKFRFIKSNSARAFTKVTENGNTVIHIPTPKGVQGTMTFQRALDTLTPAEVNTLLHEGIHASTVNTLRKVEKGLGSATETAAVERLKTLHKHVLETIKNEGIKLSKDAKYHLDSLDEFLAGLANSPDLRRALIKIDSPFENEGVFRSLTKTIMQLLGIKPKNTAFTDAVDNLHDLLTGTRTMEKSRSVPQIVSESMKGLEHVADEAYHGASPASAAGRAATAMGEWTENFFKNNFMLSSQIGKGNQPLAEMLFGNPLVNGARTDSVVDFKRLYQSVGSMQAAQVENAVYATAKREFGLNWYDQLFSRRKYREAVVSIESDLTRYLHTAHDAHVSGSPIPRPPEHIADAVEAYVSSNWAKTWRDNLSKAGLADDLIDSPYYLPVRYSADRVLKGLSAGSYTVNDIRDLLTGVVKDNFSGLPENLQKAIVNKWSRSLTDHAPNINAAWKIKASQGSNAQLSKTLRDFGLDDGTIREILEAPDVAALLRNNTTERNLKHRNLLDYNKEYTTASGNILRLDDIIDHGTTRLMERYNARMSGRAGLAHHGYSDLSELAMHIDEARLSVPTNMDVHKWSRFVDDSVDAILGNTPTGEIPDALRAAGSFSNAMVLKNSGIYGITDMAFSMYELGFSRVLKGMMGGGMWKNFAEVAGNTEFATRFHQVLNGAVKNDMRFKLIHNFAEDNAELTHVANYVNIAKNFGNSVHTVNGLRMVHAGVTNLNSGIVYDMFMDVFNSTNMKLVNGVWEASGEAASSLNALRRFGLRDELLSSMRTQHAANPNQIFSRVAQQHLEVVGQRMMDHLLQQTRLGEVSHFASLNPIGRAIVGYLAFSLGTTTRVLARMVANKEYAGMSMLMAYQMPLMLMASYTKAHMDGKGQDLTSNKLIMDSVSNMGMLGGLGVALSVFSDQSPRNGLAMMAAPYATAQWLKQLTNGGADIKQTSRVLPLAQTFIPLRILINNLADEE